MGVEPDYHWSRFLADRRPYVEAHWGDIFSLDAERLAGAFDVIMWDNSLEHQLYPSGL